MNRQLFWIVTAFLAGLALCAAGGRFAAAIAVCAAIVLAVLCAVLLKCKHIVFIIAAAIAFAAGAGRMYLEDARVERIRHEFEGQQHSFTGVATEVSSTRRGGIKFLFKCDGIVKNNTTSAAKMNIEVICSDASGLSLKDGSVLTVAGVLQAPDNADFKGDFDYNTYLKARGVYSVIFCKQEDISVKGYRGGITVFFSGVRRWILDTIGKYVPGEAGELTKGIVLGDTAGFSDDLNSALVKSGAVHIVAVSGMQVSVLISFVVMLCRFFGLTRRPTGVIGLAAVLCFAFVAGFQASVMRAVIMGIFFLLGMVLFKSADSLTSLAVSAAMLAAYNPFCLYDPGFQLTYASTLGILLLARPLEGLLGFLPQFIKSTVAVTVSAQVFAAPIVAYNFGNVSAVSLIANIIIVPYVDLIFLVSFALLLTAPLWKVGYSVGFALKLMSSLVLVSVRGFAALPYSSFNVAYPHWWAMGIYFSIAAAASLALCKVGKKTVYMAPIALFLICSAAFAVQAVTDNSAVNVEYTAVGGFCCAYVSAPGQHGLAVLSGWHYDNELCSRKVRTYLARNSGGLLDALLLTEINGSQIACARDIIENIGVRKLLLPDVTRGDSDVAALNDYLRQAPAEFEYIKPGSCLQPVNGVKLYALFPTANRYKNGLPFVLECGGKGFGFYSGFPCRGLMPCDVIECTEGDDAAQLSPKYIIKAGSRGQDAQDDMKTKIINLYDAGSVRFRVEADGSIEEKEYKNER